MGWNHTLHTAQGASLEVPPERNSPYPTDSIPLHPRGATIPDRFPSVRIIPLYMGVTLDIVCASNLEGI